MEVIKAPPTENYNPSEELVLLVDEANQPCGTCTRAEMRANNLRHRSTFVFIQNSQGQFYVQKRVMTKDVFPGFFDPCPGGVVVASDESDEASARRELEEEMGIQGVDLESLGYMPYEDDGIVVWCAIFLAKWDGNVTIQPEEVEDVKLMTTTEILEQVNSGINFCPDSIQILKHQVEQGRFN